MRLSVTSEIGTLKQVLLHRPGHELEQLTPTHLGRMLFDDIPYLAGAQKEHDLFAQTLREQGTQVRYLTDLVAQAVAEPSVRARFIEEFIAQGGPLALYHRPALMELLEGIKDTRALVEKTMAGVTDQEAGLRPTQPLTSLARHETRFLLDPIPNLYFTRDPFSVIQNGVAFSHMLAPARQRETIYGRYIMAHHPEFVGSIPAWYSPDIPYSLEGGDILVVGDGLLCVGISQRTDPEAIEILGRRMMFQPQSGISRILAMDIPNIRAYMHLDTVFTQVDRHVFTVHPGILPVLRCFLLEGQGGGISAREMKGDLAEILAEAMGVPKVTLILCGGQDMIAAQREQWNDGSNTLCVRPGTVIVYDRNKVTNRILRDHGINTIEVAGSELARGRGGPRCMSMPLWRDEVV
ncbi:MAG: arginine deiminase [Eubacteriales bacterium]|nr:arginine deiminase [Eubacteriales bacterium]